MKSQQIPDNPLINQDIELDTFPLHQALQLHLDKNLSFGKIAKIIGHPRSTTHRKIANFLKYLKSPQIAMNAEIYDKHITKLKKSRAVEMLTLMGDKDKQQKATLGNVGYVLSGLDQSIRLDQGQATSSIQILISDLDRLKPKFDTMLRIYEERKEIEDKRNDNNTIDAEVVD